MNSEETLTLSGRQIEALYGEITSAMEDWVERGFIADNYSDVMGSLEELSVKRFKHMLLYLEVHGCLPIAY